MLSGLAFGLTEAFRSFCGPSAGFSISQSDLLQVRLLESAISSKPLHTEVFAELKNDGKCTGQRSESGLLHKPFQIQGFRIFHLRIAEDFWHITSSTDPWSWMLLILWKPKLLHMMTPQNPPERSLSTKQQHTKSSRTREIHHKTSASKGTSNWHHHHEAPSPAVLFQPRVWAQNPLGDQRFCGKNTNRFAWALGHMRFFGILTETKELFRECWRLWSKIVWCVRFCI